MTSEIVQSDIDLTRRMIEGRRPDHEIITILGKRGIDTDRAALLIDDLRYGRKVVPHLPLGYHIVPRGPAGGMTLEPEPMPALANARQSAARSLATEPYAAGSSSALAALAADPDSVEEFGLEPRRMSALKWGAAVLILVILGLAAWILRSRVG